jgi:hypothetical protein
MYDDVRALLGYGFKVKPEVGAEILGARPETAGSADATDDTLPPAADRITDRVAATPSPLVDRLGLRILAAAPVPLAASAGIACLLLGALALRRR